MINVGKCKDMYAEMNMSCDDIRLFQLCSGFLNVSI